MKRNNFLGLKFSKIIQNNSYLSRAFQNCTSSFTLCLPDYQLASCNKLKLIAVDRFLQ